MKRHPQSFGREERIRKSEEFSRVYQLDAYAADRVLVVQVRENDLDVSRLGLSVSRRVGNAVVRNRWKRRIREAFRRNKSRIPLGLDIVVRPRKGSQPVSHRIYQSLPKLVRLAQRKLPRATESP